MLAYFRNLFKPKKSALASVIDDGGLLDIESKREMEKSIHQLFEDWYQKNGGRSLLQAGLYVVVCESGVDIRVDTDAMDDVIARVEIRSLFTAQCALASGLVEPVLPKDALFDLATNATRSISETINALSKSVSGDMLRPD